MAKIEVIEISRDQLRDFCTKACDPDACDSEVYLVTYWHKGQQNCSITRSILNPAKSVESAFYMAEVLGRVRLGANPGTRYGYEIWVVTREHDEVTEKQVYNCLLDAEGRTIVDVDGTPLLIGAEVVWAGMRYSSLMELSEVRIGRDGVWCSLKRKDGNELPFETRPQCLQLVAW